jgi:hypothetical protein
LVRQAVSEFDGYFLFDAVPYGAYRLRLSPASAAALVAEGELGVSFRVDRKNVTARLGQVRIAARAESPEQLATKP